MMILQLFALLLITTLLYTLIFVCSGGIPKARPIMLSGISLPGDVFRAVRCGACPLWLKQPFLTAKELTIMRRRYPWIFIYRPK